MEERNAPPASDGLCQVPLISYPGRPCGHRAGPGPPQRRATRPPHAVARHDKLGKLRREFHRLVHCYDTTVLAAPEYAGVHWIPSRATMTSVASMISRSHLASTGDYIACKGPMSGCAVPEYERCGSNRILLACLHPSREAIPNIREDG